MTEPEKYTLPRVLEIVRGHAQALEVAGKALEASEGNDVEINAMLGRRAQAAEEELWSFESGPASLDEAAEAAWHGDRPSPLWFTLNAIPLLTMAVEASDIPRDRFYWLHFEAERISEVWMDWVTEHDKDATPATTTKGNGGGTSPVSQPEGPQEEERTEEADRLMVEALHRLEALSLAMEHFRDIDYLMIFEHRDEKTKDGWPTVKLTSLGAMGLSHAQTSAVDAARALRALVYDSRCVPDAWYDAMRQCLELTLVLVPALEALERWQEDAPKDFFSEGEILTELAELVKEAHRALGVCAAGNSDRYL